MHTFKTLTSQDQLNEVAEYLRMRGLQLGIHAHPNFKARKAIKDHARAQEDTLRSIAQEIETAATV